MKKILTIIITALLLCSCGTYRVVTFYDVNGNIISNRDGKINIERLDTDTWKIEDKHKITTIIYNGTVLVEEMPWRKKDKYLNKD